MSTSRKSAVQVAERRRHPRMPLISPVTVRCESGVIEGYTENLSYCGLLVQSLTGMPRAGETCHVTLDLDVGIVEARGKVARLLEEERRFAVDLTHVDKNGNLLLATLVTLPDD
jgi:hypothetical protein